MAFATPPRLAVRMNDDTEHIVSLSIQDQLQWSRTARARGWAPDDELLGQTFMAWHALKRAGAYEGTWDQFSETDAQWLAEAKSDDEDDPAEDEPFQ